MSPEELVKKYASPLELHQGQCESCRYGRECETAHRLKLAARRVCRNKSPHVAHSWRGLNTRGWYACPGVGGSGQGDV